MHENCVHDGINVKIMKKLVLMLITVGLVFSASAQIHAGARRPVIVPRVAIIGGYSPYSFYSPYAPYLGYGYGFGYNPFYGNPGMYHSSRPTKLDLQVEDINNDYKDRIWSVKHDKSLSRSERKAKVHELKHERDSAVIDAKRNYYKTDYKS